MLFYTFSFFVRKRCIIRDCYCLTSDGYWRQLKPIPAETSNPAVVADERGRRRGSGGGIWLLGGFGGDYTARADTFLYSVVEGTWSKGPMLNTPRASAFAFIKELTKCSY